MALLPLCAGGAALAACEKKPLTRARTISIGSLAEFSEGLTPLLMYRVALVREQGTLGVVSLVCTHQVCMLQPPGEAPSPAEFNCPCHGSRFSSDGAVLQGPATEPLPWFKVWVDTRGHVMVDFATQVDAASRYII